MCMKRSVCMLNRLVAAFGVGVLVAILFEPQRVLFVTVLVLVLLSLTCSNLIRG